MIVGKANVNAWIVLITADAVKAVECLGVVDIDLSIRLIVQLIALAMKWAAKHTSLFMINT